jgi:N-acetylmuramoyl-L-alanine amidase
MSRKTTDFIVVHCAATKPSMDIGVREIDRWHRARGWLMVGYHFVIKRDGTVEIGRKLNQSGAHAKGYNDKSIGICLVGGVTEDDASVPENNFTPEQFDALHVLVENTLLAFPDAKVIGHNEISSKACPSFDVQAWLRGEIG